MTKDIIRGVTRTKDQLCPFGGYHFNAFSTPDGRAGTPPPGDATVCLHCTEPMVFDDAGLLRMPTAEERAAFARDDEWEEMRTTQANVRILQSLGFRTKQGARGDGRPN